MLGEQPGEPKMVTIDSDDPDEAANLSGSLARYRYLQIGTSRPFHFNLEATLFDPFAIGKVKFATSMSLMTAELETYTVVIPVFGQLRSLSQTKEVLITPGEAAISRPGDHTGLSCLDTGLVFWGLSFDAATLERHLSALLVEPSSGPIDFASELDLTSARGLTWWALTEPLRNPAVSLALATIPMVLKPYLENVAIAFLLSAEHSFSEYLRLPPAVAPRSQIAIAVEQIRANPEQSWTTSTIAESSFCSVRSLQAGFRREFGTTPMRLLAEARIERAHTDLLGADRSELSVGFIATRWGFTHLGRFSLAYKRKYGESPSQTLRRDAS